MMQRQRLPKKTLGEVSTNTSTTTNTDISQSEYRRINPEYWSRTYRKDFPKFKVFFDTLEDKHAKPLERKIKLLGGNREVFFGQQCTHVVTTKPFIDELSSKDSIDATPTAITNQQNQENVPVHTTNTNSNDMKATFPKKPNVAKDQSQQAFFDRAHGLGIEVWSLSKMNYVVGALMNKPSTHGPPAHRGTRHENLDKLLLEEKRYGVSTGHRNGQTSRPTYVTFNEHYVKVEDVAGVHCPILIKEFHTPTFDPDIPENDRIYPWPKLYVKQNVHVRSPFALPDPHQKSKKLTNPAAPIESSKKHTPLQQHQFQQNQHHQPQQQQQQHQHQHQYQHQHQQSQQQQQQQQQQQSQQQHQQIPGQKQSTFAMPPPATSNTKHNTITTCIPSNTSTHHANDQFQQDRHLQIILQNQQSNCDKKWDQENNTTPTASLDPVGPASVDLSKTPFTTITTQNFPSTTQYHFTQQSKSTNTHTATQVSMNTAEKNTTFCRPAAPLNENMHRMDRRMISNQRMTAMNEAFVFGGGETGGGDGSGNGAIAGTMKDSGTGHTTRPRKATNATTASTAVGGSHISLLRPSVAAKTAHDQAERRKKDLARRLAKENSKYCENCVAYYQDLDKHLQDESHQAFVRDKNNFKELDMILASTRRSHYQL
ncbi:hypothetical protein BCR42DRAFT_447439 [Absidia repens]|uniref:DBF4-type domain-containing protein n=1 Tax=Absidia repens TaxID=90262 RepID=A0A1X2ITI9_9FUNG|nr:hypothetical protein BCR42DRAFT_447439 [Absidia repens]